MRRSTSASRRLAIGLAAAGLAAGILAAQAVASTGALSWQTCIGGKSAFGQTFNPLNCPHTAIGIFSPLGVIVSPDNHSLYLADRSSDVDHFERDSTGALSWKDCVAPTNTTDIFNCAQTTDGIRYGAFGLAMSPDGKSLYATGGADSATSDSAIVSFQRDTTTGDLTPEGCIAARSNNPDGCPTEAKGLLLAHDVTVSPDGRSVYVTANGRQTIAVFRRNASTGALTYEECIGNSQEGNGANCAETGKGFDGSKPVVVSPDGKDVYIGGTALAHFKRKPNGTLSFVGCIKGLAVQGISCAKKARGLNGPEGMALSPNGKSLYVAGHGANDVVRLKRSSNGALTRESCIGDVQHNTANCAATARGLNGPEAIEVSSDGKSVYAVTQSHSGGGAIVSLKRDSNGNLSSQSCLGSGMFNFANCAATANGFLEIESPDQVALSPDDASMYVTNEDGGTQGPALVALTRTP